nr:hypothetical protein CFP56_07772 [Quercus suber]
MRTVYLPVSEPNPIQHLNQKNPTRLHRSKLTRSPPPSHQPTSIQPSTAPAQRTDPPRMTATAPEHEHAATQPASSFAALYAHLSARHGFPALPSTHTYPYERELSGRIAGLALHPTLEAVLHVLNNDLAGAHFLCRHMQDAPAWEGMYLHGLLHRVEGDYRNAEAWFADVADSAVFRRVWPAGLESARGFVRRVERLRKEKVGDEAALRAESAREFEAVAGWCAERFGTGRWEDATAAWVEPSEENRKIASKMLVGGEGWRQF